MPLQDINANSPRQQSTLSTGSAANGKSKARQRSSSAESLIRAIPAPKLARQPTPDSVIPAPSQPAAPEPEPQPQAKEAEEEKDYSDLLTKLRANRKDAPTSEDQDNQKRRRRRQLGRATSARSVGSTGDASPGNPGLDGENEDEDDETIVINEYQPSQELGWDSPGAARAREAMIKRLGGTLKEKSVPVKAIGGAMDGPSESRMTSRAGRKRRSGI
jgi:hypothetical protein